MGILEQVLELVPDRDWGLIQEEMSRVRDMLTPYQGQEWRFSPCRTYDGPVTISEIKVDTMGFPSFKVICEEEDIWKFKAYWLDSKVQILWRCDCHDGERHELLSSEADYKKLVYEFRKHLVPGREEDERRRELQRIRFDSQSNFRKESTALSRKMAYKVVRKLKPLVGLKVLSEWPYIEGNGIQVCTVDKIVVDKYSPTIMFQIKGEDGFKNSLFQFHFNFWVEPPAGIGRPKDRIGYYPPVGQRREFEGLEAFEKALPGIIAEWVVK